MQRTWTSTAVAYWLFDVGGPAGSVNRLKLQSTLSGHQAHHILEWVFAAQNPLEMDNPKADLQTTLLGHSLASTATKLSAHILRVLLDLRLGRVR